MKTKQWIVVCVALIWVAGLTVLTKPAFGKVYTIKTAHGANIKSVRHLIYENFKTLCEKYTNGRVQVQIHPSASLYGDKDTLEACIIGSIQMVFQPDAEVAKILPVGDLIGGPGLYKDADSFYDFAVSEQLKQLLEPLKKKNLYPLGHNLNGMGYIFMSNIRPIQNPSDLKGVKIRSWPAEFPRRMIKAVGADPIVISLSEVTTALQQGAVDGVFTSCVTAYASKLNELTKYYCTGMVLGPSPNIAVFNKTFWEKLPRDIQNIIEEKVWPENLKYNREVVGRAEKEARSGCAKTGKMYVLDEAPNVGVWADAVKPVRDYFSKNISKKAWSLVKQGLKME